MRVKNSIRKQSIFSSLNNTFYYYILILHKKQKTLTRGVINGPLNSIFRSTLKWILDDQRSKN